MATTSHGIHIPGTSIDDDIPVADKMPECAGSIESCASCRSESDVFMSDHAEPTEIAKRLVMQEVCETYAEMGDIPTFVVYIYFFGYVLGGWKAEVSTSLPDKLVYEVTYNALKSEAYVDTYVKTRNKIVKIRREK
jgi:hypothetical protein